MEKRIKKIEIIEPGSVHTFKVTENEEGQRIDAYIAGQFASYSRSFFEKLLESNQIKLNNKTINKKSLTLKTNDIVEIKFPEFKKKSPELKKELETLDVNIVYENKHFAILNKPHGLIVHPPHLQIKGITLVDWILENIDEVSDSGFYDRPGIVHRLDKDTSGLIIITKNNCSHAYFSDLFKKRKIQKTYLAIVKGHPYKEGEIELDIGRSPIQKNKMTHVTIGNRKKIKSKIREAKTLYKVLEYFTEYSLVQVKPITGRTHQIRVHFAGIKHPLLGDQLYNEKSKIISRQALHAFKLEFEFEGKKISVSQEPPQDFKESIKLLKK